MQDAFPEKPLGHPAQYLRSIDPFWNGTIPSLVSPVSKGDFRGIGEILSKAAALSPNACGNNSRGELVMNELQQRVFSRKGQDSLLGQSDRRREPRTRDARPVYLRPADLSGADFEEVRTMTDFSRIGFYFTTANIESYRNGMLLYAIPAFGCFNFEYVGEVVRIDCLPHGEYGIAVYLIRIGNPVLNNSTVVKSAFQSFSLVAPIAQP